MSFVLAIDQGTTSSRAIVFRGDISIAATAQAEFPQHFPASGWVEHEPEDIWTSTIATCREALEKAGLKAKDIAAIGITNQRETTVVWDRATGQAVHRAIVWQDRRTADICAKLKSEGHEPAISAKTGLIIDPYFSGTKVAWILDHVPGARERADARRADVRHRRLLSAVAAHRRQGARDRRHQRFAHAAVQHPHRPMGRRTAENPARAALDAARGEGFLAPFRRQRSKPVRRRDCDLGHRRRPAGRHHRPGLLHARHDQIDLRHRLLCAAQHRRDAGRVEEQAAHHHRLSAQGKRTYALEGSIFVAGSAVQWLRDGLGIIKQAAETGPLADKSDSTQSVYLVPAFVGLGAPYWNPRVRGALFGLTRNTGPAELAHAALESVCYQTFDLQAAMRADWPAPKPRTSCSASTAA